MKTNPAPPRREADRPMVINAPFRDLDEEGAKRAVLNGGSLLVLGIAGCGKTFYVQKLVEQLRLQGKRVDIISKTHCASQRAGGVTADHWVRRHVIHGACTADYVWVDEVLKSISEFCASSISFCTPKRAFSCPEISISSALSSIPFEAPRSPRPPLSRPPSLSECASETDSSSPSVGGRTCFSSISTAPSFRRGVE